MAKGRKPGAVNLRTLEFREHYRQMVEKYGDPVEEAFKIAMKSRKVSYRLQAIALCLKYNFPVLAAVHLTDDTEADQLTLAWGEPESLEAPDLSGLQIEAIVGKLNQVKVIND